MNFQNVDNRLNNNRSESRNLSYHLNNDNKPLMNIIHVPVRANITI